MYILRLAYRSFYSACVLWLSACLLLHTALRSSRAQITLDGSLGRRGSLAGPNYVIPAKVGQIRGNNLFYSFGQFNVRTDETATFTGPTTINNVISRVTGGQQSVIDGLLQSSAMPQANFYLLNPSGVLFGPNATLDVGGSFHVSTADALHFKDGEVFSTHLARESGLTMAPPAAFGFLQRHAAGISVQESTLAVWWEALLPSVGVSSKRRAAECILSA
jgi:filamentous hemagglutinin family protein